MIKIIEAELGQAYLCQKILQLLPEWFGIEAAVTHYINEIDKLPTFLAWKEKQVVGFLSIKQHTEFADEIYVMAVHPQFHRQGIGYQLVEVAEKNLRKQVIEYLQVKTLGASRPNFHYAQTRAFYQSIGFKPLEEFLELWQGNPCVQMVKSL
ncbi:hypothetical protein NIES4101_36050 [Calothrix sp. NIES-4101]|nr:hypothetical protein NIES4101_36050 [Calothrix sp. NIES-4101]